LGATVQPDGINFAIASRYATAVTLLIFLPGTLEPLLEVPLDARFHRTGEVWHAFLKGLEPGIQYTYRMDRLPNPQPQVHRFDSHQELLDRCDIYSGLWHKQHRHLIPRPTTHEIIPFPNAAQ